MSSLGIALQVELISCLKAVGRVELGGERGRMGTGGGWVGLAVVFITIWPDTEMLKSALAK